MRITSRNDHHCTKGSRSTSNLINRNIAKKTSEHAPQLRFATWNIRAINKKAASICDFIISKRIDVLAVMETWLTKESISDPTVADVIKSLQDFNFVHIPRVTRGGGLGFFLRKGLQVKQNKTITPLRPNSDLSQTSHCNIKGLSVSDVMRIEIMITQVKFY